jgi:hypothetical protein
MSALILFSSRKKCTETFKMLKQTFGEQTVEEYKFFSQVQKWCDLGRNYCEIPWTFLMSRTAEIVDEVKEPILRNRGNCEQFGNFM